MHSCIEAVLTSSLKRWGLTYNAITTKLHCMPCPRFPSPFSLSPPKDRFLFVHFSGETVGRRMIAVLHALILLRFPQTSAVDTNLLKSLSNPGADGIWVTIFADVNQNRSISFYV